MQVVKILRLIKISHSSVAMYNRLCRKGLSPIFQSTNALGCRLSATLGPKSARNLQCMVSGVASLPSIYSSDPLELRLRLDGVQKTWGRPTYSSSETLTSSSVPEKSVNGVTKVVDAAGTVNARACDTSYDSRKAEVEISPEKQKLAASLFGGLSKTERRTSTTGHKAGKAGKAGSHVAEKPQVSKGWDGNAAEKTVTQPQPDLVILGDPTIPSSEQSYVPFKQLEGLLDSSQVTPSVNHNAADTNKAPDMGLYSETAGSGSGNDVDVNLLSWLSNPTIKKCS